MREWYTRAYTQHTLYTSPFHTHPSPPLLFSHSHRLETLELSIEPVELRLFAAPASDLLTQSHRDVASQLSLTGKTLGKLVPLPEHLLAFWSSKSVLVKHQ